MKNIYIILSQTGTILSRIIKIAKGNPYNHASIALEPSLNKMYSFGRLNPYNPIIGGFVEEGIHVGTFKRFKKTRCKVFSIQVTDEQYSTIINAIENIKLNKEKYKFNIRGLINAEFDRYIKYPNRFYCSEFVKYVLSQADVNLGDFPEVPYPQAFDNIPNKEFLYAGLLAKYQEIVRYPKYI